MRGSKMRDAVVIERADQNHSAYAPDLPGCVATGTTTDEVERAMAEATRCHLDGLREDGLALPAPTSNVDPIDA